MVYMKKIIGIVLVVLLGFAGYKGYEYYQSTYSGQTAYAYVPSEIPPKVEHESKSGIGDQSPWYSYDYTLNFVKEDGSTQTLEVSLSEDNAKPLTPNSYVKAVISEKRTIKGPNSVEKDAIPKKVLEKLENQN